MATTEQTLPTSTIQLRDDDLDFLYTLVSNPDLLIRDVSGVGNNLTPGRMYWGSSDQPFLRLAPAHYEPQTATQTSPNAMRVTSADGVSTLPNPRLVSALIGQQPLDAEGNTISTPNPYGANLFLMSFGQFFDHGLDFYTRGGGADLVPIADMNAQLAAAQVRLNDIRGAQGLPPIQIDLSDNLLAQLEGTSQPFEFLIGSRAGRFDTNADGSVALNPDGTPALKTRPRRSKSTGRRRSSIRARPTAPRPRSPICCARARAPRRASWSRTDMAAGSRPIACLTERLRSAPTA